MNILLVPVFALFGAFLSDQAGDVRTRRQRPTYWYRATSRGGTATGNVRVDEQVYVALRLAAAARKKSLSAVADAENLLLSLGSENEGNWKARATAKRLLSRLLERDALLEELENSCRALALSGRSLSGEPLPDHLMEPG